jgi:hypothetical protein
MQYDWVGWRLVGPTEPQLSGERERRRMATNGGRGGSSCRPEGNWSAVFLCEPDDNFYAVTVSNEAKGRIAESSRALLRLSGAEQDAPHQSL